jgi:hypothetical protein
LRESKAEGKTKQNKNIGGLHFQPIGIVSLTPGGNDDGFRGINQARLYTHQRPQHSTPRRTYPIAHSAGTFFILFLPISAVVFIHLFFTIRFSGSFLSLASGLRLTQHGTCATN